MKEIKCMVGLHKYEVYKEEDFTDVRGNVLGKVIISRCSECGKIKTTIVRTVNVQL